MTKNLTQCIRSKATIKRSLIHLRCAHLAAVASAFALGMAGFVSPTTADTCKFAPASQMDKDTGVEPLLLIDGACTDPLYNESTFVITKTEQLSFQVPDGPLIPYTEVTGHFPAANTMETLAAGVRQSPTTFEQKYVFRFPAEKFWQNRSFEQQHPTGGGVVDEGGYQGFSGGGSVLLMPGSRIKENYANLKTQCWYHFAELAE